MKALQISLILLSLLKFTAVVPLTLVLLLLLHLLYEEGGSNEDEEEKSTNPEDLSAKKTKSVLTITWTCKQISILVRLVTGILTKRLPLGSNCQWFFNKFIVFALATFCRKLVLVTANDLRILSFLPVF